MFLAPTLLLGTLAASIPVILHLFDRSRYKTVPWAAMKFLLTAVEQTSRRLKFQELLLLILRTAILLLLALALARPSFRGAGGDAVDAVLVIDTSLSMQAKAGAGVTAFDRAKTAALAVLAHLPANSTVHVLTCSDRADVLGPRNPGRIDLARSLIEGLKPTERGTDFHAGIAEAARILAQGPSPNKELYLFSDMQRGGWEAGELQEPREHRRRGHARRRHLTQSRHVQGRHERPLHQLVRRNQTGSTSTARP